jgi:hypothetical protein
MKILRSNQAWGTLEYKQWRMVDMVIAEYQPKDMRDLFDRRGYEGLFDVVPKYFGMTKMHRHNSFVTFEFTDEQWTMFVLRWA